MIRARRGDGTAVDAAAGIESAAGVMWIDGRNPAGKTNPAEDGDSDVASPSPIRRLNSSPPTIGNP